MFSHALCSRIPRAPQPNLVVLSRSMQGCSETGRLLHSPPVWVQFPTSYLSSVPFFCRWLFFMHTVQMLPPAALLAASLPHLLLTRCFASTLSFPFIIDYYPEFSFCHSFYMAGSLLYMHARLGRNSTGETNLPVVRYIPNSQTDFSVFLVLQEFGDRIPKLTPCWLPKLNPAGILLYAGHV